MARSVFSHSQRVGMTEGYRSIRRRMRRPQHSFAVKAEPFRMQPILLAPVLAGETLKSLLMQSRVVTDPLASPLVGWWKEYYFFYVKLTDLDERALCTDMLLKNSSLSSLYVPVKSGYYNFANTVNWAELCLKRVMVEYFRNEGEPWDYLIETGTLPKVSINGESWMNSLIGQAYIEDDNPSLVVGADDTIKGQEVEDLLRQWKIARDMQLTDLSYEDYLRTFGVNVPEADTNTPELLRYARTWTYPTNTVSPTDGSVSSACSWAIAERADKDRYFKEPGFIFGCTTTRAKVYMGTQAGSAAGMMVDALSWFPASVEDPSAQLLEIAAGAGPLTTATVPYSVDLRDLLIYGDQYVGGLSGGENNIVATLPTVAGAAMQNRYVPEAGVNALFKTPTNNKVREDGMITLNIASKASQDYSAGTGSVDQ